MKPWDVLEVLPRLLGGGGDGGATGAESRSCYLEMYLGRKPDKVSSSHGTALPWWMGGRPAATSPSRLPLHPFRCLAQVNPEEERLARWTTCHLSGEPLNRPIVADELGNLFNKEAVLQALLSKSLPLGLKHIQGLKHVVELKLEEAGSKGTKLGGVMFCCEVVGCWRGPQYQVIHSCVLA